MKFLPACVLKSFLAMVLAGALSATCSCADDSSDRTSPQDAGVFVPPEPEASLVAVEVPNPLLPGSLIRVQGLGLPVLGEPLTLHVVIDDEPSWDLPLAFDPDSSRWRTAAPQEAGTTRQGALSASAWVSGQAGRTDEVVLNIVLERALTPDIDPPTLTTVHYGTAVALSGSDFPLDGEGDAYVRFVGAFDDVSGTLPVDVALPLESNTRESAFFAIPPSVAALREGRLVGEMFIETAWLSGDSTTTDTVAIDASLIGPVIYAVETPMPLTVGRAVEILGAGFIADPSARSVTELHLTGTFSDPSGAVQELDDQAFPLEGIEGGQRALLPMTPQPLDGRLVAESFGVARGQFEGMGYVETSFEGASLSSDALPVSLQLEGNDQVVWVRFSPGFYTSLARFGLGGVPSSVEAAVFERLEAIFADYRIDFVAERPTRMASGSYSIVDVGGADPNGIGLLGYDNTPGKDVGNLRLGDRIGGENAQTQQDGFPGFGGVFIESMLYWSRTPGLGVDTPPGAPDPDPLFDEIFGAVRQVPAGSIVNPDTARVEAEARAIRALGYAVGETIAHEVGHSLGLADPYGNEGIFHNTGDTPGCLMDRGEHRPLGERVGEPGYAGTRFCGDAGGYLSDVLGRR